MKTASKSSAFMSSSGGDRLAVLPLVVGLLILLLLVGAWAAVSNAERTNRSDRLAWLEPLRQARARNEKQARLAVTLDAPADKTLRLKQIEEFKDATKSWNKGHDTLVDRLRGAPWIDAKALAPVANSNIDDMSDKLAAQLAVGAAPKDPFAFTNARKELVSASEREIAALDDLIRSVDGFYNGVFGRLAATQWTLSFFLCLGLIATLGYGGWLAQTRGQALVREHSLAQSASNVRGDLEEKLTESQQIAKTQAQEREKVDHVRSRLIALWEASPELALIARTDMKLVYANHAVRRLLHLDDPQKLQGRSLVDLFPARLRQRWEHDLLPLAAREGKWRGEWTFVPFGDGELPFELELIPHRVAGGAIDAWLVLAKDQRQSEKVQMAVRESEIRLRAIFETSLDAIVNINDDGHIVELNPAACRTFGCNRKDALGHELAELFVPLGARARYRKNLETYRTAGEGSLLGRRLELPMQRKSGEEFLAELAVQPSVLHGEPVYTVFVRDVTERRRAEEKVRASEERFRQLAEAIDDVFWITSADGREVQYVSPVYETIWGRSCESLMDRPTSWISAIHADDRQRVHTAFFGQAAEGAFCQEFRVMRPDKSVRWVRTCAYPVRSATGEVVRIAGVSSDITEQKLAADEIRRKNQDLETLLYVTSHDLREPLRAIENFSKLVHDRYAPQLDEKGQDFLQRVIRGAQRLDRLLEDVLTLSRAQRSTQASEEVDAQEIIDDVLQNLENRIRETGAKFTVVPPLPHLKVDRRWVTQAVYNLVVNAIKFARPGELAEVEIAPFSGPGGTGLVVRDRGIGVAPEHAERIFQLFQRAVGREVEGTGAGLAIVRQICERHGGKAWVAPRPGGGSEFMITFGEQVEPIEGIEEPQTA